MASEYRYADPIVDEKTLVVAISPERRDDRHFGGGGGAEFRRTRARRDQHAGLAHNQGGRRGLLPRQGPRYAWRPPRPSPRVAALGSARPELARTRDTVPERELEARARLASSSGEGGGDTGTSGGPGGGSRSRLRRGPVRTLPRSWPFVSSGARGALAQGDLLPPQPRVYPAGEMKHGPIALVDENCPVVAVLGEGLPGGDALQRRGDPARGGRANDSSRGR